ncbi:hypothetical protein MMC27_004666 [Xylographa pallens]|nr:hypothetical protein [Xylographa pallens]
MWFPELDPRFASISHDCHWEPHGHQNCCTHHNTKKCQHIQRRPRSAKAQGKQQVRFICHRPVHAKSAVAAATSTAAALAVMHQLRLLGDLLARFQVLDAACVSNLEHGSNTKSCLQLWRRLHRPYTDRIVAVLQAIEANVEAHTLLHSYGFVSKAENWWTTDVNRRQLRVSHLLTPRETVGDKKRREQITDVISELTNAVVVVLPRVEEATTRAAEEMKEIMKEAFESFSI